MFLKSKIYHYYLLTLFFIGYFLPFLSHPFLFSWVDVVVLCIMISLFVYYVTIEVLEKLKSKRSTKEP